MTRRNQLRTLRHVREAREQVARGELSRHIRHQQSTFVGLHEAQDDLARNVLPREANPSAFLAAVASRRAQVQQVYTLRSQLEQAQRDVAVAQSAWLAADQSRTATLKLVERDSQQADAERERRDARERDDRRVAKLGSRTSVSQFAADVGLGL